MPASVHVSVEGRDWNPAILVVYEIGEVDVAREFEVLVRTPVEAQIIQVRGGGDDVGGGSRAVTTGAGAGAASKSEELVEKAGCRKSLFAVVALSDA
jgi:hypothetical protein